MKTYFDFEYDGERHDLECEKHEDAERWADDWWIDRCEEDGDMENGEFKEDEGSIIEFYFDEEGEKVDIQNQSLLLSYEYYHGDYAEHFNQGDYI